LNPQKQDCPNCGQLNDFTLPACSRCGYVLNSLLGEPGAIVLEEQSQSGSIVRSSKKLIIGLVVIALFAPLLFFLGSLVSENRLIGRWETPSTMRGKSLKPGNRMNTIEFYTNGMAEYSHWTGPNGVENPDENPEVRSSAFHWYSVGRQKIVLQGNTLYSLGFYSDKTGDNGDVLSWSISTDGSTLILGKRRFVKVN
jgi:hypothetical protein